MVDSVVSTDTVVVVGGPSLIDLNLEVGATGARGSQVYSGYGNPNDNPPNVDIKVNDLYINAQSTSEEYSFLYQYRVTPGGSQWVQVLKLQPTTYAKIDQAEFVDGQTEIIIAASNIVDLTTNQSLSEANFNIQCNVVSDTPVASSISLIEYTLSGGLLKLKFKVNATTFSEGAWSNLDGTKSVHILITVV